MSRSRLLDAVATNRYLLLTLAVAFVLRLGLAVAVQITVDKPPARLCLISGDAEGYWELAQNLVAGKDYAIYQPARYVLRVPGFPLLLAVSLQVFGPSPLAARFLLAGVGTLACGLTYCLGRELLNRTAGLLAALYTALSPTMALFSVLILSETTFAASMLLSLLAIGRLPAALALKNSHSRPWMSSSMAGALIGLASLVRPTWLYVGAAIGFAVILLGDTAPTTDSAESIGQGRVRKSLCCAALLCGMGLVMAPWTVRNYWVTGRIVPTTLWVGPSLYDGLHPGATGDSDMRFVERDNLQQTMTEYEVDREYRRRAWAFVFQNPARTAWLALVKQRRYWSLLPNAAQFQSVWMQVAVGTAVAPLLLLGVWGIWCCRGHVSLLVIAAGPILLFAALHLLFVGSIRYRLPAEYPFSLLAAAGLQQLVQRYRNVTPR